MERWLNLGKCRTPQGLEWYNLKQACRDKIRNRRMDMCPVGGARETRMIDAGSSDGVERDFLISVIGSSAESGSSWRESCDALGV